MYLTSRSVITTSVWNMKDATLKKGDLCLWKDVIGSRMTLKLCADIHFPLLLFHSYFGEFNRFPNKPWFLRVCSTSLLKTLGKGEIAHHKQFLLCHSVFYPIGELSAIFIKFRTVICKCFSLEESKILLFGKGLIDSLLKLYKNKEQ